MHSNYKPKLKDGFRPEKGASEGVFLLSERHTTLLRDSLSTQLIPFLSGQYGIDEIIKKLRGQLPEPYIYYGLEELKQQGYLDSDDVALPTEVILLCHQLDIPLEAASHRLRTLSVSIRVVGEFASTRIVHDLIRLLEAHQIRVTDADTAVGDLDIILCDDYLQPRLAELNQAALADGDRPWLLVKPIGTEVWVGPLFVPGQTGCWTCLAERIRGNRPVESYLVRQTQVVAPLTPPQADLPAVVQTGLSMVAMEVLKWVLQDQARSGLEGQLVSYDALSLEIQKHRLTRRPQCPSCGWGETQSHQHKAKVHKPLPLVLGSRPKTFTADGGHRCQSPEASLKQYQHHISPITGVVRALHKLPSHLNQLQNSYVAQHHFLSMFDDLRALTENIGGRSGGKGKTDAQARMSAFGEAIERYSGVFQGNELRICSTYNDLRELAIHPNDCMNFSDRQYATRQDWNLQCEKVFQRVPAPFDEAQEIEWTPIWSLTERKFKYLPTAYCYFGYPKPPKPDCWADTNGCAAGNTLEEAILQGFMELVERDAVTLWWYNRLSKHQVDLDSFEEPYFQSLKQAYQAIHRELWVLEITSDLNIPSFVAVSRCCDRTPLGSSLPPSEDIIFGFGTHFDAKLAISRALTEVNQLLPAVLSRKADGTTDYATSADTFTLNWWKTATLENQPYLAPIADCQPKRAEDYSTQWSDDLLDDIHRCQQIVEQKGLELLVLDQTRPDIGLNVVKVVVPGLRHYWKRLGPGRLYDVPVQMGWLAEPLSESELNPLPMCL